MRNLASIVTVATKNKMFEKDRICVVTFNELGYEAIVPIDINVGDKMVFIQEGSILPEIDRWEFLRKRCYKSDLLGFLIKPMVMGAKDNNGEKGDRVKSWGLCVTLEEAGLDSNLKAGTDVTDKLNIRKYEPEEDASPRNNKVPKIIQFCMAHKITRWIGKLWFKLNKKASGSFPTEIISKSDETTIQNCKSIIYQFPNKKAFVTVKMEGQSFTCSLDTKHKNKFYVCSRNNRYNNSNQGDSTAFFEAAKNYDIETKLRNYYKKTGIILMLQGEQCGPSIQGNIYNFSELRWFLFRMKGLEKGTWVEYNYPKMKGIANVLGIDCVPLIETVEDIGDKFGLNIIKKSDESTIANTDEVINNLVKYAEKSYWRPIKDTAINFNYIPESNEKLWKDYLQNEGIVIKSEDYNKELNTGFSFKVKNCAYAEKLYTNMHKTCESLQK